MLDIRHNGGSVASRGDCCLKATADTFSKSKAGFRTRSKKPFRNMGRRHLRIFLAVWKTQHALGIAMHTVCHFAKRDKRLKSPFLGQPAGQSSARLLWMACLPDRNGEPPQERLQDLKGVVYADGFTSTTISIMTHASKRPARPMCARSSTTSAGRLHRPSPTR